MVANPLYDLWRELHPPLEGADAEWEREYGRGYCLPPLRTRRLLGSDPTPADIEEIMRPWHARRRACREFAWAVPSPEALDVLAAHGRIVEMGAGTGYWAGLLAAMGVDIVAYDKDPPPSAENVWHRLDEEDGRTGDPLGVALHFPVKRGTPEALAGHADRTLFLCWPPYADEFGAECLRYYRGGRVVYVGESASGCTGDDKFHETLETAWVLESTMILPQWEGIHDRMFSYRRRP